jgi:hypothetical protein
LWETALPSLEFLRSLYRYIRDKGDKGDLAQVFPGRPWLLGLEILREAGAAEESDGIWRVLSKPVSGKIDIAASATYQRVSRQRETLDQALALCFARREEIAGRLFA